VGLGGAPQEKRRKKERNNREREMKRREEKRARLRKEKCEGGKKILPSPLIHSLSEPKTIL
jgi:hypothetical protein